MGKLIKKFPTKQNLEIKNIYKEYTCDGFTVNEKNKEILDNSDKMEKMSETKVEEQFEINVN